MKRTESPIQRYRRDLRPIMEMLLSKRTDSEGTAWEDLVSKTENYVLKSPDQYLNLSDAPRKEVLQKTIQALFNEFRENLSI